MISTSSYDGWKSDMFLTFSISGDRGKGANYNGRCYSKLAPKKAFWNIFHENIAVISDDENIKYYIKEYYKQVLSKLDPEKVYDELNNSILLCYENSMDFCHRHIVAAWFELLLDVEIPEKRIVNNNVEIVNRPSYIKEYLEEVMKKNKNMRGFNSLRALYLFEKSELLEEKANILEEKTGHCYDNYRNLACYLRCDADEAEKDYNLKNTKIKIKK